MMTQLPQGPLHLVLRPLEVLDEGLHAADRTRLPAL